MAQYQMRLLAALLAPAFLMVGAAWQLPSRDDVPARSDFDRQIGRNALER